MDRSKQKDGVVNDSSHTAAEPDGDLFTISPTAAGEYGGENFANEYASASQAFEIGRRPHPIDGPQLARPHPKISLPEENVLRTGRPAFTEKPDQQTVAYAKPIRRALPARDDSQMQTSSGDLARLMRVGDVAAYLNVSISKIWRLLKNNRDFPPPIRMDGTTRWDRLDIDHFIETGKSRGRSGR